jgi:hypothetical protein
MSQKHPWRDRDRAAKNRRLKQQRIKKEKKAARQQEKQ